VLDWARPAWTLDRKNVVRRAKGRGNGRMIGGIVLDYYLPEMPSRYFIES
jgi:hypothetical protein